MEIVTLGRTGVNVSRISLGTWSYGGPNMAGKNQPVGWGGQTDEDSKTLQSTFHLGDDFSII